MEFRLNPKGVDEANQVFDEAWADVVAELELKMQHVIETPGLFPTFPVDDIVDTGRLRDSQVVTVKDRVVRFQWNPHGENGYPYAPAVYSGFRAWGKKYIPGRRFPEKAFDLVDVPESLRQKMIERGIRARVKLKKKLFK